MNVMEIQNLVAGVVERLRARGLRRTPALELLVAEMARHGRPMTIAELCATPSLSGQCDPATIYRLLMKLEEHGVVRRLHVRRLDHRLLLLVGSGPLVAAVRGALYSSRRGAG